MSPLWLKIGGNAWLFCAVVWTLMLHATGALFTVKALLPLGCIVAGAALLYEGYAANE